MTLSDAQEYFEELRREAHSIFCLVSDFDALFPSIDTSFEEESPTTWQTKVAACKILLGVASRFFSDLNAMMHEHYVLKLSRLGDPASTNTPVGKRDNLTIDGMQKRLRQLDRTSPEIENVAVKLRDHIKVSAKPARDSIIAHSDWERDNPC